MVVNLLEVRNRTTCEGCIDKVCCIITVELRRSSPTYLPRVHPLITIWALEQTSQDQAPRTRPRLTQPLFLVA
jgi:hypothetical protein